MCTLDQRRSYRHILILESRDWRLYCQNHFDPAKDIVLTYDFGLQRDVEKQGGHAFYVDHLVDNLIMQEHNFLTYRFFRDWHLDAGGQDIFTYRGVPFGFSFRLDIWNDLVFHVRTRLCLERLRALKYERIFVGTHLGLVESTLEEMGLVYASVQSDKSSNRPAYYFPIHRWMDEKIRTRTFRHQFKDFITAVQGTLISWFDKLLGVHKRPAIFIQEYYPTREILQRLKQDCRLRVVLAHYSWGSGWLKYLVEHPIPVWGRVENFQDEADRLMRNFCERRYAKLLLSDDIDISESIYRVIEKRISSRIAEIIRTLDCVIRYLDKNPINMEILIANIGLVTTLVDCVAKSRGIPSYLIINGLLGNDYLDEGKYATFINAYSASIKEHYFRGMDNIVCLGDPRMDAYVQKAMHPRVINRDEPTVTIGASGHNNIDLNSYLAVEFEFLHDVLMALRIIKGRDVRLRIVIKVRANGYRRQYEEFVQEYFPGLVDKILDNEPMSSVLEQTDYYISIYSQTLFEASCLGIPCLYYKKDTEIMDPPFDGHSELVTVGSVEDLVGAIADFRSGHERYDAFLERAVMEKYVGPLDGGNIERNLHFIYDILEQSQMGAKH